MLSHADREIERRAVEMYGAGAVPFFALCDGEFLRDVGNPGA